MAVENKTTETEVNVQDFLKTHMLTINKRRKTVFN